MNSQFETDFEQFRQKLLPRKSYSEIRKEYLKLVKIARKEYTAYKKIGFGFLPDREELKARIEQFLKHLAKRKRCF